MELFRRSQRFIGLLSAITVLAVISTVVPAAFSQTNEEGTLSFSPNSVKNGEKFTIVLTGGPANTPTKIWVKNNDGMDFQDFGGWNLTDALGSISVERTLNCNAYQTLEPGKSVAVGNRKLTQAVYLEYVGTGKVSKTTVHTKDCTTSSSPPPSTVVPPPGTARCYFYEPYGGVYHFLKYPQPAYYEGSFMTSLIGKEGDPIPVAKATLKWRSVKEVGNSKSETLKDAGYTAVLSSDYSDNAIQKINSVSVPLEGSYDTKISGKDITYKLDLKKDGATVATCSAKAHLVVDWRKQYVAPIPANVSFPGETAYPIFTSKGTSTAAYKFADPIQKITFTQNNWTVYAGQNFKNLFWIANRYGGGPAGRWDISDPWNPGPSEVIGIAQGGSAFVLGKPQPAEHKGPFSSGLWPHPPSMHYGGGVFGDLPSGEGRFAFASGESVDVSWPEPREWHSITPVISAGPNQGLAIGQLIDGRWQEIFTREGSYVIDATANGKFFLITGGGAMGYGTAEKKGILQIFDLTDLTGSTEAPRINPISSQAWQNITDLEIIEVPGIANHFIVARTSTNNITEKPRFYVGEIHAETGRIIRSKSFILDITGVVYSAPWSPSARVFPGSNLNSASVGQSAYVFMNERFTRFGPAGNQPGTLKLAAYKFNPADLTFTRKGDISFEDFPSFGYADGEDAWKLVPVEGGKGYPLLAVLKTSKELTYTNSYNQVVTVPVFFDINMHSLKSFLDSSTPQSLVFKNPDIVFGGEIIKKPFTLGQVITVGPEQTILGRGTYHAFLKPEAGKNNLYLYRKALLFDGRSAGDPVMAYHEFTMDVNDTFWLNGGNNLGSSFRAVASIRVDKVDASAFSPNVQGTNPNPTSTVVTYPNIIYPPTPNPIIPPPLTDDECVQQYRTLCDQITQLQKEICLLAPTLAICKK